MTQKVKSRSETSFSAIYFPRLARKKNRGKDSCFAVLFRVISRVSRVKGIIILALFSGLVGFAGAAELYYTNRTYSAVEFNIQGEPMAIILYTNALRLTNIVRGAAISTNLAATCALEREAIVAEYLSATDAWEAAVAYYTNRASLEHWGKIFDNVGWVRGTNLARDEWGAYLWTMQNRIVFRASTSDLWQASNNVAPARIKNVIVGSLGIYRPLEDVVDVGPSLKEATNNFPAQAEAREFYADITNVFYVLESPILITPRSAYACVGGGNVQYSVTTTNITNGVTWSLIPNLSGSGGAAIQSNADWHYREITPGNIATNYKVRATSIDNTNLYDEVDLGVRKVDIVETNIYLAVANTATLHLTVDSSANVQWKISPSVQNGAFIQGSSVGTSIVFNAGSIPTNYTVKAYAEDLTNCYDTCAVSVIKIEKIPLGGITNLSKNIIGKVYIPTKWGGSNMLSGTDFQLFYTDGTDLSMETAIQITKGELDGNRVAQGNPCVYEVPAGKFGWYYVKITDESEQTIASTFYEHGEVAKPWQGYYWSFDSNTPPNLYQDGYALDKYDQVYGTTSKVWEAANHVSSNPGDGHCWGTAVASALTNQPVATTSTNNVEFTQEDMEALYIELAAFCYAQAYEVYSVTNIPVSPVSDALGEDIDGYCDEFHTILSQVIIEKHNSLVGNLRDYLGWNEDAIWNHAVYKYKAEMQQMPGQNDESIIRVKTWIWSPKTWIYPSTGSEDRLDNYWYDIKYDTLGEIDGSYANQNWRYASKFPPESLSFLASSYWTTSNTKVTLEKVKDLY